MTMEEQVADLQGLVLKLTEEVFTIKQDLAKLAEKVEWAYVQLWGELKEPGR